MFSHPLIWRFVIGNKPPLKREKVGDHYLMREKQKGYRLLYPYLSGVFVIGVGANVWLERTGTDIREHVVCYACLLFVS